MRHIKAFVTVVFLFSSACMMYGFGYGNNLPDPYSQEITASVTDTIPLQDRYGDFINDSQNNPFDITPNTIDQKVEYDPVSGHYIIFEKIGDEYYRMPTYMTFEEYLEWKSKQQEREYFSRLAGISTGKDKRKLLVDPMDRIDIQENLIDRLFGGTEVNIQPQGNIDLSFGGDYQRVQNPNIDLRRQTTGGFDFDMDIRMNVDGNIGEKLNLGFNYDTQSTFDFDRKIKLEYDSEAFSEDDIIKKIEAGNVSLPLRGNLIQGAQSLFGLKTELQFGHLRLTAIASQQKSEQNNIRIENGASVQEFEITPDEYDENRHFFLSHYNRATFEENLRQIPYIATSFRIVNLEVWISDDRSDYQENSKLVAALADIAEPDPEKMENPAIIVNPPQILQAQTASGEQITLADNRANELYADLLDQSDIKDIDKAASILKGTLGLKQTTEFEVYRGRLLSPGEYTFHPELGFLSLNVRLRPNQVLGVAYEYYYTENCDEVYKVGSLSAQSQEGNPPRDPNAEPEPPKLTFVKMLKSSNQRIASPSWDLMMKNVYPLRTNQLTQEDFEFDIFFEDDTDGSLKKFIPEEGFRDKPLLNVFNLDRLNQFLDPQSDGIFDYVEGITVISRNGSIVFPVLEPFGSSLDSLLQDSVIAAKYKFQSLYNSSVTNARQQLDENKFVMKGRVKSTVSGDISLGPFVPRGSVRVTAGGKTLIEGQDYEIDYSLGRLRILNEAYLSAGTPINVSFEDNAVFSLQQKTMLGLRADYEFSKNLTVGATYLRLFERPFTEKVNIGDDPINNRIFGLDVNYSNEAPWLTKAVDKLPFYSTKEPSSISFTGEVAALKPGHSGAINLSDDDGGVLNIDDFEGSVSGFLLGSTQTNIWTLASTPSSDRPNSAGIYAFPEWEDDNTLAYGANRALLNWYVIDQTARDANSNNDPYSRAIDQQELFERDVQVGNTQLYTFDLSYYPQERGPYNFDEPDGISGISAGLEIGPNGEAFLRSPESRWAGIQRYFSNTDFEAANYEFIEFWMLNPYMGRADGNEHLSDEQGRIVFQLGNVSEDILKDNTQFYENAIETDSTVNAPVKISHWGKVPLSVPVTDGFDFDEGSEQDVGLDGLNDIEEKEKFAAYIDLLRSNGVFDEDIFENPSNDNFLYFGDESLQGLTLLEKYKKYNHPQGNAPLNSQNQNNNGNNVNLRGNPRPDKEDLNNNKSLDQGESYYEYILEVHNNGSGEVDMDKSPFFKEMKVVNSAGSGPEEKWYRVQIPIKDGNKVNGIEGFRSIQFMKMYLTNFHRAKTFRLAEFELVRNLWRKLDPVCEGDDPPSNLQYSIGDVGVEENSNKEPFNYTIPKGIKQERLFSTFSNLLQDEKSMQMDFCELPDGCEASIYKLAKLDMTYYKKLQMFVHAESKPDEEPLRDKELSVFLRLGKDFENNYYEYELPLTISDPDLSPIDRNSKSNVWPDSNMIDIQLSDFTDLKKARIVSNEPLTSIFVGRTDAKGGTFRMKGNPSLGYVKVIQIGIRNRDGEVVGDPLCGEVWINELRAAGLEERGGYAGQAQMQLQMADLGELNLAGSYQSVGWGGLDQRLEERSQNELIGYDIAANLQLGKFFPDWLGLNLPFYGQYSKSISNPLYDPYELDITVEEKVDALQQAGATVEEIEDVKDRSKEVTTIKTFNFTNVRFDKKPRPKTTSENNEQNAKGNQTQNRRENRGGGSPKPWSIGNFSASYAYTETDIKTPILKEDNTKEYTAGLDYNYSIRSRPWQPFKGIKSKSLKLISEFNINFLPNSFSFSTNITRLTSTRTFRLPDPSEGFLFRFDDKRFNWDRRYSLSWDFTKSLKFSFDARASSIIDELRQVGIAANAESRDWVNERGEDYTQQVADDPNVVGDYWKENIKRLGRSKNYDHSIRLGYNVPTKLIPYMDWVQIKADYKSTYTWSAGALIEIDNAGNGPGNVIQNSQNRSLSATFSFDKLYGKWQYLKDIERGKPKTRSRRSRSGTRGRNGSNASQDVGKTSAGARNDRKKEDDGPSSIERALIRPLMLVRSVKFNYKENLSSVVPGFDESPNLFGMSSGFDAPGYGYILGLQPNIDPNDSNNWLRTAAANGWLNTSRVLNEEIHLNQSHTFDAKIAIEPFKDFKLDVDLKKTYSNNHKEVFKNKGAIGEPADFLQLNAYDIGSFEATYSGLNTLFNGDFEGIYQEFRDNRSFVSTELLSAGNPNAGNVFIDRDGEVQQGYDEGYGPNSYDVVLPAFLAAYSGTDIQSATLDLESTIKEYSYIPKPNWTLRYDGMDQLPWFKKIFSNISISHGYKSLIKVNRFNTSIDYDRTNPFAEKAENLNYFSRIEIPALSITEQFSPLIGVSIKTKSDLTVDFEYKKLRNLDLRLSASELVETRGSEYTFGFAYTIKNFKGFFGGSKKKGRRARDRDNKKDGEEGEEELSARNNRRGGSRVNNERGKTLTINLDFAYRDDRSLVYKFDNTGKPEDRRGQRSLIINPNVDYEINENLTLRFFVDYSSTKPYTTTSYPVTSVQGGVTVRFTIN